MSASKAAPTAREAERIARTLGRACDSLHFGRPVVAVYNPLDYAWPAHRLYLQRYARRNARALFVGMNPGPFGMAQTGVPFGEVNAVRTFLQIDESNARIARPKQEHAARPVLGFACTRSEVSGARVWGWVQQRFGTADAWAREAFIWNWCPLAFMSTSGANVTPDKLAPAQRRALEERCDLALRQVVAALAPQHVVGFGTFAAKRAALALANVPEAPPVCQVLHPSPASPAANRGWATHMDALWERLQ